MRFLQNPVKAAKHIALAGMKHYFKRSSLVYEQPVDATGSAPTILVSHPHGVFCIGLAKTILQPELENVYCTFSHILYMSPLFRAFTHLIGRPASAGKDSILKLMRARKSFSLMAGGFEEAAITSTKVDRVFIKHRKGFVKYAIQHGYSLTPCYAFGERLCYSNLQLGLRLRLFLSTFGIPTVVPFGRWWCPVLPRDECMHMVVGSPIAPPSPLPDGTISPVMVDAFHAQYVAALVDLFDRHKATYYGAGYTEPLEVW